MALTGPPGPGVMVVAPSGSLGVRAYAGWYATRDTSTCATPSYVDGLLCGRTITRIDIGSQGTSIPAVPRT